MEADGSSAKLDLTSLYVERAEALRQFGQFDDARNALAIARDNLSPELTRWQINILLEEAETYLAEQEYDDSATVALEALKVVDVLQLGGKKKQIRRLYGELYKWNPNYPLVRLLGTESGLLLDWGRFLIVPHSCPSSRTVCLRAFSSVTPRLSSTPAAMPSPSRTSPNSRCSVPIAKSLDVLGFP